MRKLDLEQEKNAVDYITNCMFSLCFLESISDFIFSQKRDALTVGQFYDQWVQGTGAKEPKIPYNLGAILGYLYCGILFAKEYWHDLLPNVDLAKADSKWSISGTACISSHKKNTTLK